MCRSVRTWDNFSIKPKELYGREGKCKKCRSHYDSRYSQTREGFLKGLLRSCKKNTDRRNQNNLTRKLIFDDTYEDMCEELEDQKDKCAVSGLTMNFASHHDWQCSPERMENSIGYNPINRIFICLEFQLSSDLHASQAYVDFLCTIEERPHPRLTEIMSNNFIEKDWIPHCIPKSDDCKECRAGYDKWYEDTARGRMVVMAKSARQRTKTRNAKGRSHEPSEADSPRILKKLQEQKGRCFYTGHHIGFEGGTLNCMSIELFDTNHGYTNLEGQDNWGLIMVCLNTTNCSSWKSLANEPKAGSGGWSKAKIEYLRSFRRSENHVS